MRYGKAENFHYFSAMKQVKEKTLFGGKEHMVDQLVQRGTSFKREPITISDLHVNAEVHGWLFAVDVQNRTAKNGRPFRQLKLRDQKGNVITARQFDLPRIETLMPQKGKVVLVDGLIEEFQHTMQIKLFRGMKIYRNDQDGKDHYATRERRTLLSIKLIEGIF
jgi:hypothetical protein